jgi:raffinose synthase
MRSETKHVHLRNTLKTDPKLTAQLKHLPSRLKAEASGSTALIRASSPGNIQGWTFPGVIRWRLIARVSPWWFEPSVAKTVLDFPAKHEIPFLLGKLRGGGHVAWITLASPRARAVFQRSPSGLRLETQADAGARGPYPVLVVAVAADPYEAVRAAMTRAADALKSFRLAHEKQPPDFVRWFGWCTWDAFYKEVSALKIQQGLRSFQRAGVTPGFLVIDDGWQPVNGFQTTGFTTDRKKFPGGLAPVVAAAKRKFGVQRVGVWHALQGYWQGVDPRSELGRSYATVRNRKRWDTFRNWPAQFDARVRDLVHPDHIQRFYNDFYRRLREDGVDLVKVDNQASLEFFTRGVLPISATHRAYQDALQGAAAVHFGGNLIHCMSNVHDIVFAMGAGVVWRNSDDFYPKRDAAAQARHVVINALNNLWTHTFSLPDWDMFWSRHPYAAFHARARAISGGPVYVSDRPGRHDTALLKKLVLRDGRALRWPQPALPAPDSIYRDPQKDEFLLKVGNRLGDLGAVAVFHAHPTAGSITTRISPADIPALSRGCYAAYRQETGELKTLEPGRSLSMALDRGQSDVVFLSPLDQGVAVLGLLDKFNGPAAVSAYGWSAPGLYRADVIEGGRIGFVTSSRPRQVRVNGRLVRGSWRKSNGLLTLQVASRTPISVELEYS